jgi:hypothetical protein
VSNPIWSRQITFKIRKPHCRSCEFSNGFTARYTAKGWKPRKSKIPGDSVSLIEILKSISPEGCCSTLTNLGHRNYPEIFWSSPHWGSPRFIPENLHIRRTRKLSLKEYFHLSWLTAPIQYPCIYKHCKKLYVVPNSLKRKRLQRNIIFAIRHYCNSTEEDEAGNMNPYGIAIRPFHVIKIKKIICLENIIRSIQAWPQFIAAAYSAWIFKAEINQRRRRCNKSNDCFSKHSMTFKNSVVCTDYFG